MPNKATALVMSTHPGPALAVLFISVVLSFAVGLEAWRIALLGLVVAANQASVGLSNDWLDAERDAAVGRTDKPVALGLISARSVRNAALLFAPLAILLSLPLGWPAAVAHGIFLAAGWSYNAWLKRTAFSILPYLIGFGVLPAMVTLSRADPVLPQPWVLVVGALLGAAAHFANVLPDLEDDTATGVSGLPHRLGRRVSAILPYLVLAVGALVAFFGAGGTASALGWLGLGASVLIAGWGIGLSARASRAHFRLIIAGAVVNVAMLALTGDRLLAG